MIKKFYDISKVSAYLQIPYLLWLIFAGVLNLFVYFSNMWYNSHDFKGAIIYENIKLLKNNQIDSANYNEKLSIGDVIARFRNRYRFTQDYMGRQLGVSRSTLSLVKTNRCTLSNDVVNRFFSLYGNQLLNDEKLPFMQVLDSKTIISNLIINNDLADVLCNIEKLKLSKDDITALFNSTLEQAKQLKKQRKRM